MVNTSVETDILVKLTTSMLRWNLWQNSFVEVFGYILRFLKLEVSTFVFAFQQNSIHKQAQSSIHWLIDLYEFVKR